MSNNKIRVALADDHALVNDALAKVIGSFDNFLVTLQASNGKELIDQIKKGPLPDLVILDLNMPVMDGYETARWLNEHYPEVYIVVLTMIDSDLSTVLLINSGVRGVLIKKMSAGELHQALDNVIRTGFCYSSHKLVGLLKSNPGKAVMSNNIILNENELLFLKLICRELTYKEVADKMGISLRTIENYRDSLVTKLGVVNRIGLVIFAIRNGLVNVDA